MPLESHGIFHPRINLSEHRVLWGRARSRRSRLELGTGGQDGGIGGVSPQLGWPPRAPHQGELTPSLPAPRAMAGREGLPFSFPFGTSLSSRKF